MAERVAEQSTVVETANGGDRRATICKAVCELLAEVGYDRMTMDAIAAQAKAGKSTIYRMWPDKPKLVAEALKTHFGAEVEAPDTGSLRGDLMALMESACKMIDSEAGEVIVGVVTAAAHDAELAQVLNQAMFADKEKVYAELVRNAAARGEIRADTDPIIVHDVIHSMISGRRLWNRGPLDDEFVRYVVDDLLIPALTFR